MNSKLPQFKSCRKFDGLFHLFTKNKKYKNETIIGRDYCYLKKLGFNLLYDSGHISWHKINVAMVSICHFSSRLFKDAGLLESDSREIHVQKIKESKYKSVNLTKICDSMESMNLKQKGKFYTMMKKIKNYSSVKRANGMNLRCL